MCVPTSALVQRRWLTWDLGDLVEVGEDVADHVYMGSLIVVTSVTVKKTEGAVGQVVMKTTLRSLKINKKNSPKLVDLMSN